MFLLLFQDIGEFERVLVSAVTRLGFSAGRIPRALRGQRRLHRRGQSDDAVDVAHRPSGLGRRPPAA